MSTPEATPFGEELADAFFDWAKANGILQKPIEDPADAFSAGAMAALAWVVTPEGRPFLQQLREATNEHVRQPLRMVGRQPQPRLCSCGELWPCNSDAL